MNHLRNSAMRAARAIPAAAASSSAAPSAIRGARAVAASASSSAGAAVRPRISSTSGAALCRAFSTLPADELFEVPVPAMGDSITEGSVGEVVAGPGSVVAMDDIVCILETDKVSVEVRAPAAGLVVDFLAEIDDVVAVGAPLFRIDTTVSIESVPAPVGVDPPAAAAPAAAPAASPAAAPAAAPAAKPATAPKAASSSAAPAAGATPNQFNASPLNGSSAVYVDSMYLAWKEDPSSVHVSWHAYFSQVDAGVSPAAAFTASPALSGAGVPAVGSSQGLLNAALSSASGDTAKTLHLIAAFQRRGHEMAKLDPLGLRMGCVNRTDSAASELDPATYGFDLANDWERPLDLDGAMVSAVQGLMGNADVNKDGVTTLHELLDFLNATYCGSIGIEIEQVTSLEELNWLRSRIEVHPTPYSKEQKLKILERLTFSENFESILAKRFGAMKRFGLEGNESMIPGLKVLVDRVTELGVEEIVMGMPHRGRLSTLANVVRKPIEIIFKEFKGAHRTDVAADGVDDDWSSSGDVKYHMGTSYQRSYPDGRSVQLELLPNPSHLEAVNPLVVGKARAKMDQMKDEQGKKVMPIVIHGDAAFAGQGVVYETMQMAKLDAYQTGGTINVICNNQVGFTANPEQGRSTRYASDLGKAFGCPIFHVNADDVEAVTRVFELAAEYRQQYHKDVIVDLVGYRKHGHNEVDEPKFTQPQMYDAIAKHPSPVTIYSAKLVAEGSLTQAEVDEVQAAVGKIYDDAWDASETTEIPVDAWMGSQSSNSPWNKLKTPRQGVNNTEATGLPYETLNKVGKALHTIPESFNLHRNLKKASKLKQAMFESGEGIDWATGEALAIGTLLLEEHHVRLTGQDVERGTFSHRHAKVVDQKTGEKYTWVNAIEEGQKHEFDVHNSFLSEYGVLGFELGYSFEHPDSLVMWEAQFGDFVNGAQIIIDQFLSAGEAKWMRQSALVMLLPHGYQGMGPEHSSCRIERFLQQCDEDPDVVPKNLENLEGRIRAAQKNNWSIVNPTTPANYFHVLRRQLYREFRKPLVIPSTKSLLRDKLAVSSIEDFGPGTRFQRAFPEMFSEEEGLVADEDMKRVVFCSGKIYYELLQKRRDEGVKDVAIVRIEQLSPFPFDKVADYCAQYGPDCEVVWAQEEPKNMGPWYYVDDRIATAVRHYLPDFAHDHGRATLYSRGTMSSPAEGYGDVHAREQDRIVSGAILGDTVQK